MVIGYLSGPVTAILAAVFTIVVLLLLEFYVQRRLYTDGRYWGVLLIVIMLAAVDAFGFIGLLLAAPIALAMQIAINEYLNTADSVAVMAPAVVSGDLAGTAEAPGGRAPAYAGARRRQVNHLTRV